METAKINKILLADPKFQPVLVSWYTPTDPPREQSVICTNEKQLQFFRETLCGIRYWEQRLYSASKVRDKE